MMINAPIFALTQLTYHKLIMPPLRNIFPNMAGAYSLKLYAVIFSIYILASLSVMIIMISYIINKHSLVALKRVSKSTNKLSIMKIEMLQLSVVISMIVLIVSAVISRYEMFIPFEQYLHQKGYMVIGAEYDLYPEEFEEIIGNSDYIMNNIAWAYDKDIEMNNILYSDEFIEAYSPPIDDGIWLSDTDMTYENSGYIPIVITYCGGRYHVGETFEFDDIIYDNNNNISSVIRVKYKIVGILKDQVSVASYLIDNYTPNDYTDIYEVFSDDYEDYDFVLSRASDSFACFGGYGPIHGTQFVFCNNMSDSEYEDTGRKLNAKFGLSATPLDIVYNNSINHIYEQMYTLFPIAVCIFILTIISTVSISAIYTKRQLRNYAIFYICGARWRTCALRSLKNGAITCAVSAVLSALILIIGKATFLSETVISFGIWHFAVCAGVIVLYLALSMIMPLSIIGSAEPREVLKEE